MSELTKLLEGVNVEWKTIGEISELYGGLKGKSKKDFNDGNAKFVSYKNIFNNIQIDLEALENVNVSPNENQYSIRYGDVLFTGSSEIASEAGMSSSVTKSVDTEIYLNSFSFGLRFNSEIKLIPEFTKYLFRSKFMRDAIAKTASGVTRYNVSKKRFLKLEIPIPYPDNPEKSLKIQQEIARVLDNLSEETNQLTAALQKELQIHQNQYNFYREELFKFEGKEVEWKSLGEVGDVTKLAGYEFTKYIKYSDTGKIIALRGLNVKSKIDLSNVKYIDESDFSKLSRSKLYVNDMLFTYVGTIGEIALIDQNDKYYLAPNVSRIRFLTNNVLPRYMFFYFKTNSFTTYQVNKYLANSSMKNLTMENIRKFRVPIPSLSEQERIVKILDDLDVETQYITSAIQKEITLRNKHYKYYRDHLLTFSK